MEETSSAVGKFMDPEAIIKQLEINPGDIAADFGCGPGYFTFPFTEAIGKEGHMYALDVLPQALETVASKAKINGITNISTSRVNLEKENGSRLESESLNWVVMKDVLFQNKMHSIMLAEAKRTLKHEGKVLFIEWNGRDSMVGPQKNLRIPEEQLKKMVLDAGFHFEKDIKAGDYHYAFVCSKK